MYEDDTKSFDQFVADCDGCGRPGCGGFACPANDEENEALEPADEDDIGDDRLDDDFGVTDSD